MAAKVKRPPKHKYPTTDEGHVKAARELGRRVGKDIRYDKEKADRAVRFVRNLRHVTGQWHGMPFNLLPWQEHEVLRPLFGYVLPDGTRFFHTAFIAVPKKNGKSELAAAIALYLLVADINPRVGKPEPASKVFLAAASIKQADYVFEPAAAMWRESPALMKRGKAIDSTRRIVVPKTYSRLEVLSADVKTKHGLNAHGRVIDELHAQPNRDLVDTLDEGAGDARVQPLMVYITTAGVDKTSICMEKWDYARKVQDGILPNTGWLVVIYELPEDADWRDEKNWYLVNPSLGQTIDIAKVRKAFQEAKDVPAKQSVFRRMRCNQWVQAEAAWIDLDRFEECMQPVDEAQLRGRPCYTALDLASTTDLAAIGHVFPPAYEGDVYRYVLRLFVPTENLAKWQQKWGVPYEDWVRMGFIQATEGDEIDYKAVLSQFDRDAQDFDIQEVAYDRWGMTQLAQDLADRGLELFPFNQQMKDYTPPTKGLIDLVMGRRIHVGVSPVLRWMSAGMVLKTDSDGRVKPEKAKSKCRIDGMVALIMALDRALRHEHGRSVYEERGLRTV